MSDPNLALLFDAVTRDDVSLLSTYQSTNPKLLEVAAEAWKENPLHVASKHGSELVAQQLVRQNPEFARSKNRDGYTPLHLASAGGHLRVVEVLVGLDSQLCLIKDNLSMTPLQTAVVNGHGNVMKAIITVCPKSVGQLTSEGETLLLLAAKNYRCNAFEVLLDEVKKQNLEQLLHRKDKQGNNVLHIATSNKLIETIRLLLPQSSTSCALVRVNSLNISRKTAVDLCYENSWDILARQICNILYEAGGVEGHALSSLRWPPESRGVIFAFLGMVSVAAFTIACNVPESFLPKHAYVSIFHASDVMTYTLPPIFYLLVLNTVIFMAAMVSIVVLLWSLPFRSVVVFLSTTIAVLYAVLVNHNMPKFVIRIGSEDILSPLLVGLLAAALICFGALASCIVKYLTLLGAQIFSGL